MNTADIIKRSLSATALGLLLSSTAVYAQNGSTAGAGQNRAAAGNSASTDLSSTSGSSASASADKVSATDKQLMQNLAQANKAEIEVAKLAKEKSKDDQVQSFAQKLIDDHTDAGKKLQDLAQKKDVSLPDQPDSKQQAEKKKLESLSGDKFDRQFLQQAGVQDHRKTHDLLVKIQKQAKDKDLIHLASNLIPVIDGHLDTALKLTGPNSAAATSTGSKGMASGGSAAMTGRPGANNVNLGSGGSSSGSSGGGTTGGASK